MLRPSIARFLALSFATATAQEQPVVIKNARTCRGSEKEWGACPDLPPCNSCEPVDCLFGPWNSWYDAGGCTGLCLRQRNVETSNNECGVPCTGPKIESRRCLKPSCVATTTDCKFGPWDSLELCSSPLDQSLKTRTIAVQPSNGGKTCAGSLDVTVPCGETPSVDCKLSVWGEWTQCSASCGGGYQTRMRRISQYAALGGRPCDGDLRATEECGTKSCGEGRPCVLGAWNEWKGCDSISPFQKYRLREVESPAENDGKACNAVVKETAGCDAETPEPPTPCVVSPWDDWVSCDKSCDGGQTFRTRRLVTPPLNGGSCDETILRQVLPCATIPCELPQVEDCRLSPWTRFSECSNKCGTGIVLRSRKILAPAGPGGKGCNGALDEVDACENLECERQDCKWSLWDDWSACTCTCGGGTKRRNRVVRISPTNGGKLCATEDKSEIAACNTESCQECIDGSWSSWSAWSGCSATCDSGYRSRHRDVEQRPNECGKAPVGLEDDFEVCSADVPCVPDVNCQVSQWTEWSSCSCTCFGISERHRQIVKFATGNGRQCSDVSMKEITQCNPGIDQEVPKKCGTPGPPPCELEKWSSWGECSSECDGGAKTRTRGILTPSGIGGVPCDAVLAQVTPCNTQQCPRECRDCKWSEWSQYGSCSKCGDQKYRHRSVVVMANKCGKICDPRDAKETTYCKSPCEQTRFCAWSDWSADSACSADCGPATQVRQRILTRYTEEPADFLFKGSNSIICTGSQLEVSACAFRSCKPDSPPVDCRFDAWGTWTSPTCTQLCERSRVIATTNAFGGKVCDGPIVETRFCPRNCSEPVNCKLSAWSSWNDEVCGDPDAQRFRSRTVIEMGANGGEVCSGVLKETDPCEGPPVVVRKCELNAWDEWSACSATCGGGLTSRNRTISAIALGGGAPCLGSLSEISCCSLKDCPAPQIEPCKVSSWTPWGVCSETGQKYRERKVVDEGNGRDPCDLPLKEVGPCNVVVNCVVSEWTAFDACDKSCAGGQQQRHRQVEQNPKNGGTSCPSSLVETRGCNLEPCGRIDCKTDDWTEWGACSAECGSAQRSRSRKIVQYPQDGGAGCDLPLVQEQACRVSTSGEPGTVPPCPVVNCEWDEWSEWSSCSCDCDGGQRSRDRHIKTSPQKGGRPCAPYSKEEIEPCNTQKCSGPKCVDGAWDEWEDWETCSKTCGGGLTWRSRKFSREANECGTPAVGSCREFASCNQNISCIPDVNCEFGEWSLWSDCTKECDGIKRRSRTIKRHGKGQGAFCLGDLKQTSPCNPGAGQVAPPECQKGPPVNCELAKWSEWGACSVACSTGQQVRSREITAEPANGGRGCDGPLSETRGCFKDCNMKCVPLNCEWGEWNEWSACDKCGGQKKRFRHVLRQPNKCGTACDPKASEETAACPRKCHEPTYCVLGEWQEWGGCSAICGNGIRSRERTLQLAAAPSESLEVKAAFGDGALESKLEGLRRHTKANETRRLQEMVASFACGLLTLVAGLASFRAFSRSRDGHSFRAVTTAAAE